MTAVISKACLLPAYESFRSGLLAHTVYTPSFFSSQLIVVKIRAVRSLFGAARSRVHQKTWIGSLLFLFVWVALPIFSMNVSLNVWMILQLTWFLLWTPNTDMDISGQNAVNRARLSCFSLRVLPYHNRSSTSVNESGLPRGFKIQVDNIRSIYFRVCYNVNDLGPWFTFIYYISGVLMSSFFKLLLLVAKAVGALRVWNRCSSIWAGRVVQLNGMHQSGCVFPYLTGWTDFRQLIYCPFKCLGSFWRVMWTREQKRFLKMCFTIWKYILLEEIEVN